MKQETYIADDKRNVDGVEGGIRFGLRVDGDDRTGPWKDCGCCAGC
jgi:hypothetical protein